MFRPSIKTPIEHEQFKINYICSCLLFCKIRTSKDLVENFDYLLAQINQNPEIFDNQKISFQADYRLLKKAIKTFNNVNAFTVNINVLDMDLVKDQIYNLEGPSQKENKYKLRQVKTSDDLSRVTKNYDRFSTTYSKKKSLHLSIAELLKNDEFVVCPHVILGAGDTGTTVWLERYKSYHGKTKENLLAGILPSVLMIAEGSGSWQHNYTLAQPHSTLERTTSKSNPSDYISTEQYLKNPYANGRHVYQANQVSLVETEAALLEATVLKIEKMSNHLADWKASDNDYRLILKTPCGIKAIYTNDLNVCTGLGPPRNAISKSLIDENEFKKLNQLDSQKKYTPIVDGNQFILTGTEEDGPRHRTIVIYGGGGTAAACYRKGFFGNDVNTEVRAFDENNKKNTVIWTAKQFNKAGTGRLATTALQSAKARNELFQAELVKIEPQANGKLLLTFQNFEKTAQKPSQVTYKPLQIENAQGLGTYVNTMLNKVCGFVNSSGFITIPSNQIQIECDQLVYSIGQDDKDMRKVCEEIDADLIYYFDDRAMILNVCSQDKKVNFFGAAAMAVREKIYMDTTWAWLQRQNIGGDVGPGSMPPSRAQIKRYNALNGIAPESINSNIDSDYLIEEFLCNNGVEPLVASAFVRDLLEARKGRTSGCDNATLKVLLEKHALNVLIEIYGHGNLILKKKINESLDKVDTSQEFNDETYHFFQFL